MDFSFSDLTTHLSVWCPPLGVDLRETSQDNLVLAITGLSLAPGVRFGVRFGAVTETHYQKDSQPQGDPLCLDLPVFSAELAVGEQPVIQGSMC